MTKISIEPLLRPDEVADALGVSLRTVYRLINDGKIKTIRVGHNIRVKRNEFMRFIESDLSQVS